MAKQPMTIKVKSFFDPKEGQYGVSQGSYIITDKGEFKCYNSGPQWFTLHDKGRDVQISGEWKQNQSTQKWYLACSYGQVNPSPDPSRGPPTGPANNMNPSPAPPLGAQAPATPLQAPPRDYYKENSGKCLCALFAAQLRAGVLPTALMLNTEELLAIASLARKCMDGVAPLNTQQHDSFPNGPAPTDNDASF